jgi:hypothetical protein
MAAKNVHIGNFRYSGVIDEKKYSPVLNKN